MEADCQYTFHLSLEIRTSRCTDYNADKSCRLFRIHKRSKTALANNEFCYECPRNKGFYYGKKRDPLCEKHKHEYPTPALPPHSYMPLPRLLPCLLVKVAWKALWLCYWLHCNWTRSFSKIVPQLILSVRVSKSMLPQFFLSFFSSFVPPCLDFDWRFNVL